MRSGRWALCFWPGLLQLWQGGLAGLAAAIGFGLLVDFVVFGSLVWTDWVPGSQVFLAAAAAVVIAAASGVYSMRQLLMPVDLAADIGQDLFPLATGEYLKGNWFEVQRACQELLRHNPRDIEAQLLLATTCRRANRPVEARQQLTELSLLAGSEQWRQEIDSEWDLLAETGQESTEPVAQADQDLGRAA